MQPLLLLDIDETIVHVSFVWLRRAPDFSFRLDGDVYHVYIRPGVRRFLERAKSACAIGVWTAAERRYAICILRRLLGRGWRRRLVCF